MSSIPSDRTTRLNTPQSSSNELEILLPEWEEYKIESLLGEGGMARVYKAFDPKLNRYVALKFIRTDDETLKKRLLREARAQAQIEHDYVCKIYEVGEVDGRSYIAMQLIQGMTFQKLAPEMTLEQKVVIMQYVSDAVQSAHKIGIIHRDIKPSNIMVERKEDGSFRPYVMDFGIAREISDPSLTATNVIVGTPAFMAPEQMLSDSRTIDRRVDIYALGATLYFVLAGQPPFRGSGMDLFVQVASHEPVPLKKSIPSIPDDLDIIVSKCLEKDPSQRYDSARALSEDLKRYLEGEPILAHRASLKYRLIKKIKKNKTVAAILAMASMIILASAGFSIFSYWRASTQVEIARQFSQSVEAMDWTMRVAHMAPLHDIRKEKAQVLQRMTEIETMMKNTGKAGMGPGSFALGRGYLTLQDHLKARLHLEKAWNAGYQGKDVANALGLTLGALYSGKLAEVDRISDKETRKIRLHAVEKEYRDPAVRYLRMGSGGSHSQEYGEALLSYYEKKWNQTLELARRSSEKVPWFYESRVLKGDVFSRLGEEAYQKGDFEAAKKQFQTAEDHYSKALDTSRSDPAVYESLCSLSRSVMEVQLDTAEDAKVSYDQSNTFCKKAIVANPDSANAYAQLAQTAWRWGEAQFEAVEDPSGALMYSIEMSRKAQALKPDHAFPYYTMGTAYGYLADYHLRVGADPTESLNESIKALKITVERDPASAPAYTNLGVSYFSQGALVMARGEDSSEYFLKAIDSYNKALQVSPRHLSARANIANAFTHLGKNAVSKGTDPSIYFQQSIENYQKAIEINPNHWMIHNNLSTAYFEMMQYELDHGKDPTATYRKDLATCNRADELNPANLYSAINIADAYIGYGEYLMAKGESPLSNCQKAEERLILVTGDSPEAYLGLAETKRLEAQYSLRKKESPIADLLIAKKHYDQVFKINSTEYLVPLGYARLELIRSEWFVLGQQSPEQALDIAEKEIRKALDLNSKSPTAYLMLGEINLMRSEWKNSRKQSSVAELQEGLSAIEKSIQLKPDLADAYAVKGKLLLLDARSNSDRAESARIGDESVRSFQRAFAINPMLQSQQEKSFQKAILLSQEE